MCRTAKKALFQNQMARTYLIALGIPLDLPEIWSVKSPSHVRKEETLSFKKDTKSFNQLSKETRRWLAWENYTEDTLGIELWVQYNHRGQNREGKRDNFSVFTGNIGD